MTHQRADQLHHVAHRGREPLVAVVRGLDWTDDLESVDAQLDDGPGSQLLGAGTAMVYPTLLAALGDLAHPGWRASAVGVYRFWRDLGYAVGALFAGLIADLLGVRAAIWMVASVTLASGLVVAVRMRETRQTDAVSDGVNGCISVPPLSRGTAR